MFLSLYQPVTKKQIQFFLFRFWTTKKKKSKEIWFHFYIAKAIFSPNNFKNYGESNRAARSSCNQRFVSSIGNIEKALWVFNYLGRSGLIWAVTNYSPNWHQFFIERPMTIFKSILKKLPKSEEVGLPPFFFGFNQLQCIILFVCCNDFFCCLGFIAGDEYPKIAEGKI